MRDDAKSTAETRAARKTDVPPPGRAWIDPGLHVQNFPGRCQRDGCVTSAKWGCVILVREGGVERRYCSRACFEDGAPEPAKEPLQVVSAGRPERKR